MPFIKGPIEFPLPISKKTFVEKEQDVTLGFEVKDNSSIEAMFVEPPTGYVIENVELATSASMREMRITIKRLTRLILLYANTFRIMSTATAWKYPRFSVFCLIAYVLCMAFLPSQAVIPIVVLLGAILCICCHPRFEESFGLYLKHRFFAKKFHKKPYPLVRTIKSVKNEAKAELNLIPEKQKSEGSLLVRWKVFKRDAAELQNGLIKAVAFAEKLRNLILWEDSLKTLYLVIALFIVALVAFAIPTRLIFIAIGIQRFYKGWKRSERKLKHNIEVCSEVLSTIFKSHLVDFFITVKTTTPWPQPVLENVNVQKKIIEAIRIRLDLDVDVEIFKEARTPADLLYYLSSADEPLTLKDMKGDKTRVPPKGRDRELGYIYNIPSEYYRLQNPRLL
mmetsp:Transcript_5825/g.10391  ORF Transcript_5825/g.10391 Transcript_5825/m.10391 type:complete len:394 (+) Transcript_5825:1203-2384(+)